MLLDELIATIETLKQRITDHSNTLRGNETRTRMALIDPLLQVLGWDTADPSLVIPEFNVKGLKADYALMGRPGDPMAILEAKKFGEPLHTHLGQMLNYSNMAGIEYAGITDGDCWELYEVFRRGALEDRKLLNLRISESPSYQSALNLLLLWRPNLSSGHAEQAKIPIANPIDDPIDEINPPLPDLTEWVPLAEFDSQKGTNCPTAIRFADGSEHQIHYYYELVIQTIRWLYAKRTLSENDFSNFSTDNWYLFHTTAKHPSGRPFYSPKRVEGTPLFVEANMSSTASFKHTNNLLEHCGHAPAGVYLKSNKQ